MYVLNDYLAKAASVGTIKSESCRVYSTGEFTRDSPKDKANNKKMKEN